MVKASSRRSSKNAESFSITTAPLLSTMAMRRWRAFAIAAGFLHLPGRPRRAQTELDQGTRRTLPGSRPMGACSHSPDRHRSGRALGERQIERKRLDHPLRRPANRLLICQDLRVLRIGNPVGPTSGGFSGSEIQSPRPAPGRVARRGRGHGFEDGPCWRSTRPARCADRPDQDQQDAAARGRARLAGRSKRWATRS